MSESNKEELAIIRLLVEQNAEALKLLRLSMGNDEEESKRNSERLKEVMELLNFTGILKLVAEKMRKPRIVETPSKDGSEDQAEEA